VIDDVVRPASPVTIRPEGVAQWAATISGCTVDELSFLIDRLMWELSEHEISIVDQRLLRTVFGPMVDASRERLLVELERHRGLVAAKFGEGFEKAFATGGQYEYPLIEDAYYAQTAEDLREKLQAETQGKLAAQRRAALTDKERKRLTTLENEDRLRKMKAQKKKRKQDGKHKTKGRKR
jgi:hypothetical protein